MSRKDTIIVSVCVNLGLLAILFLMAANPETTASLISENKSEKVISKSSTDKQITTRSPIVAYGSSNDELDRLLQKMASNAPTPEVNTDKKQIAKEIRVETPVARAPQERQYIDVTVKSGDILGKIAQEHGTTVSAIMQINHMISDQLRVGQILKIPVSATVTVKSSPEPEVRKTAPSDSDPLYYTVEKGDNPWKIAKKFHVKFYDLLEMNHLDEGKARNLKVGDRLRVR